MHHRARQAKRMMQPQHGSLHIALGNVAAHYRRANRRIFARIFGSLHHLNAQPRAVSAVVVEALAAVVPEAVIESHHQRLQSVAVAQQRHECRRIERSQLGSEIHENEIVNALVGDAADAVVEGANPLLPGIVQHILRVVAKRDHSSSQAALASLALERLNKRAVPEVKTVEHANSGCNCHRRTLLRMVDYLHLYLLK